MQEGRFVEMLQQAQSGDEAAADWVFAECFRPLRSVVQKQLDPILQKARLEPEDIIQEVYALAWPHLASADFDNQAAFFGWLKTIAKNKMTDIRRRLLTGKHDVKRDISAVGRSSSSYRDLIPRLAADTSTPSSKAGRHEAVAILVAQMWRLPQDYRQLIQWRFIQGLSVAEVARRLKRSEPAVHMLCHRALNKLRELMGSPSKYLSHK